MSNFDYNQGQSSTNKSEDKEKSTLSKFGIFTAIYGTGVITLSALVYLGIRHLS